MMHTLKIHAPLHRLPCMGSLSRLATAVAVYLPLPQSHPCKRLWRVRPIPKQPHRLAAQAIRRTWLSSPPPDPSCLPPTPQVYVVGEVGIQEELDLKGIKHFGGPDDADKKVSLTPGSYMEHDPDVGAVVVGFDR